MPLPPVRLVVILPACLTLVTGSALSAQPARAATAASATKPTIRIVSGSDPNGAPTPLWTAVLHARHDGSERDSLIAVRRTHSDAERAWVRAIESRQRAWEQEIAALALPFTPVSPPPVATVVLGDRGASDAFAHDEVTIGFNLTDLVASYGDANAASAPELLDRLFRHEYTHLLQKAWLAKHPYVARTALEQTLLDLWMEGIGNFYSLSSRWQGRDGRRSADAQQALDALEPKLVARLAAIACARDEDVRALRAGLTSGPFSKKWGALPVALWLEDGRMRGDDALRQLVVGGPPAVLTLAAQSLPPALRPVLDEVGVLDSLCAS